MSKSHVTVVGAGIVGVTTALRLQRSGFEVSLLDAQVPGMGCSFGNAGLIARSSFMPLASPQTIRQVPAWLLDHKSPLKVRWRYLPKLLPWLVRYLKSGLSDDLFANGKAIHRLSGPSVDEYMALMQSISCESLIKTGDYLQVYRTRDAFEKASADMDFRRQLGFKIDDLQASELQQLEPGLSREFNYGHRLYDHAYVHDPCALVKVLYEAFIQEGGQFHCERALDFFEHEGRSHLRTQKRYISSDYLVIACGAFSARLLPAHSSMPLETERGYHITCPEPAVALSRPIMEGDNKFIATPMAMGHRFAGTVELAGLDEPASDSREAVMKAAAQQMLPGLNTEGASFWLGFRPTLPDSLPVIDFAPKSKVVVYAFGHQHLGLTCAPMTAKVVEALLHRRRAPIKIDAFSATRFC